MPAHSELGLREYGEEGDNLDNELVESSNEKNVSPAFVLHPA